MLEIIVANMQRRLDELEQMVEGLSKRIDALEEKMKLTLVPEQQTTTFTTRTDAIEDFVQNFPNANAGQVYRIVW